MITLKTLAQATQQEIFDQVATHLLTQNKKSVAAGTGEKQCLYRGPEGLKCAAGCLIADDEYLPEMDDAGDSGWHTLTVRNLVPDDHHIFITALQNAHDAARISDSQVHFKPNLIRVAERFMLDTSVLEKF